MAPTPTVSYSSCYAKPGTDGTGVSERDAKPEAFSAKNSKHAIPLKNYLTGEVHYDTLYQNAEKVFYNNIVTNISIVKYLTNNRSQKIFYI